MPFYVSAKSGDQVPMAFFHVAAQLTGVKLTKLNFQMESQKSQVKAVIVDHDGENKVDKTAEY